MAKCEAPSGNGSSGEQTHRATLNQDSKSLTRYYSIMTLEVLDTVMRARTSHSKRPCVTCCTIGPPLVAAPLEVAGRLGLARDMHLDHPRTAEIAAADSEDLSYPGLAGIYRYADVGGSSICTHIYRGSRVDTGLVVPQKRCATNTDRRSLVDRLVLSTATWTVDGILYHPGNYNPCGRTHLARYSLRGVWHSGTRNSPGLARYVRRSYSSQHNWKFHQMGIGSLNMNS